MMRFQKLKGKNIIKLHEKMAKEFIKKVKRKRNIVGIVCTGGIGRGYADKYSDIDITIFVKKNAKIGLPEEGEMDILVPKEDKIKYGIDKIKIDWGITDYEKVLKEKWDMETRWAFSQVKILYDPEGKIRKLIKKKVVLPDKERKWLMMEGVEQSHYYGIRVPEIWICRGDVVSAHQCMYYGLEMLFQALFALNKQLIPPPRWKLWYSRFLKWRPQDFERKIKRALSIKEFSKEELEKRKRAIIDLWEQIKPKVEKEVGMKWEEFKKII